MPAALPLSGARHAESPGDPVMRLQHAIGNRAVAHLLQRAPAKVRGGVETTEVSPEVARLLADKKVPYAREVTFEVLDSSGKPVLQGRMDYFFRDPRTGQSIVAEIKGLDLEALTANQKLYVPMFEKDGATIRITSRKGGALKLPAGSIERVRGENFLRIGRGNLKDFADALEQVTTGQRVKFSFRDAKGLRFFKTEEAFDAFLAQKGITRTRVAPAKTPAKPVKPPLTTPRPTEPSTPSGHTKAGPQPQKPAPRSTEPTPHPSEPAPHATERSSPVTENPAGEGKGGGGWGGVVGIIVPWVLGEIHQRAKASRVSERAKDKGYVPEGDRGGWLDKLGDILFDPTGEGERNVPITARVNMAKWRQTARDLFGRHNPGDTVVYRWDYYRTSRSTYSRYFVYMLGVDGRWFIVAEGTSLEGAHNFSDRGSPDAISPQARDFASKHPEPYHVTPWDEVPPDINDVISPTVPDSAVERQMTIDETIA